MAIIYKETIRPPPQIRKKLAIPPIQRYLPFELSRERENMNIPDVNHQSTVSAGPYQGWTSSSSDRGTFDILWSCLLTTFLCGWTTICINVPTQRSTWIERLFRKSLVFCEAMAGPEFIFHNALGQYLVAKESVIKFKDAGFFGWTVRHGFYAGMGGFMLQSSDFVDIPLTLDQVFYLVTHGYIDYASVLIDKSIIEDKNKFDLLTRGLTTIQLLWFFINVIARIALGMAITTLELSTIAFVFCTICTCYCWRYKPQDVSTPIPVELKVPLATVLMCAGDDARRPYSYSPLDFANRDPHWFQYIWRYCLNITRSFGMHFHPHKRPIEKVWNDEFLHLGVWHSFALAFVQLGFAAIHFAAWNFHFPSDVERQMWRACCCFIPISMTFTWVVLYFGYKIFPRLTANASPSGHIWQSDSFLFSRKNNSSDKNPKEDIPFLVGLILLPMGLVYVVCRMYIVAEDVVNLRLLPSSAFSAINWASFLPHF